MDTKTFEAYSHYYDLLYKDKDYTSETNYIDDLIKQFAPNTSNILELGCGTGIHASKLVEKGYIVEGIDRSETMLQRALELQSELPPSIFEKLSFFKGDIRSYESAFTFDTIISLFHVMSYMTTYEDLNHAIKTVKKHLKNQGVFIFDCWHGPGVLFDKPVLRSKFFENEFVSIKRDSIPQMRLDEKIVDVNFDILIHDKLNNEDVKLTEIHSMRYLFTEELYSLMEINGLEIVYSEEWMSKSLLSEKSWNACYICRNKI